MNTPDFDKMTDDEIYAWILNEATRLRDKEETFKNEVLCEQLKEDIILSSVPGGTNESNGDQMP